MVFNIKGKYEPPVNIIKVRPDSTYYDETYKSIYL